MFTYWSSDRALGTPIERARNAAPEDDDPRLPRVGELVALHSWRGPRLWVGRVRSAYDRAVSVAFDTVASRPAKPHMPGPGERVELSGMAGIPVGASGVVRGHKDGFVLLRDVTADEERPERALVSVRLRGRVWCEDRAGTGCGVEVLERFSDGLCVSAPAWAHPGDEVRIAGPLAAVGDPIPAVVVACRERRHEGPVAHVAFLAGASEASLAALVAGLSGTERSSARPKRTASAIP
jgi:hypothetical protein